MDFEKEDDYILLLLLTSGITIFFKIILPKSRQQLVWVKPRMLIIRNCLSQHIKIET